jgi:hypothetical protein
MVWGGDDSEAQTIEKGHGFTCHVGVMGDLAIKKMCTSSEKMHLTITCLVQLKKRVANVEFCRGRSLFKSLSQKKSNCDFLKTNHQNLAKARKNDKVFKGVT